MANENLNAFDALAAHYRDYRPSYPEALLDALATYAELHAGDAPLAVDVGAGTGIATRQIAAVLGQRWRVLGVEPGAGMIEQARADDEIAISFVTGRAEELPVGTHGASLVIAAQAVQWFDRRGFYSEAARALQPRGTIALLQNNRAWQGSALLDSYETLLERYSPGYSRHYRDFDYRSELIDAGFEDVDLVRREWIRQITRDEFVGMANSSSKVAAAIRSVGKDVVEGAIGALIDRYAIGGRVGIPYLAELFLGRSPLAEDERP
jgi:ubiquinone/menaquinone biosynthesis C-methylase UbiE